MQHWQRACSFHGLHCTGRGLLSRRVRQQDSIRSCGGDHERQDAGRANIWLGRTHGPPASVLVRLCHLRCAPGGVRIAAGTSPQDNSFQTRQDPKQAGERTLAEQSECVLARLQSSAKTDGRPGVIKDKSGSLKALKGCSGGMNPEWCHLVMIASIRTHQHRFRAKTEQPCEAMLSRLRCH